MDRTPIPPSAVGGPTGQQQLYVAVLGCAWSGPIDLDKVLQLLISQFILGVFVALNLAPPLRPICLGRPYQRLFPLCPTAIKLLV